MPGLSPVSGRGGHLRQLRWLAACHRRAVGAESCSRSSRVLVATYHPNTVAKKARCARPRRGECVRVEFPATAHVTAVGTTRARLAARYQDGPPRVAVNTGSATQLANPARLAAAWPMSAIRYSASTNGIGQSTVEQRHSPAATVARPAPRRVRRTVTSDTGSSNPATPKATKPGIMTGAESAPVAARPLMWFATDEYPGCALAPTAAAAANAAGPHNPPDRRISRRLRRLILFDRTTDRD